MDKVDESSRRDQFCEKITTSIWQEIASKDNPYQSSQVRCHGYEHLQLINNKSFIDVLFLLFKGELPTAAEHKLLERLFLSLIHPGPRHNASRAAMNAAVSKTHVGHILPLALNVLSGEINGSHEVYRCMKFLQKHIDQAPDQAAKQVLMRVDTLCTKTPERDLQPEAGFGSLYGDADRYASKLAENLFANCEVGKHMLWAKQMIHVLGSKNIGWKTTGLAAAALLDLGFSPYSGEMLFQMASLPGIAAQAEEKSNCPITDMPFISEENYVIETD